MKSNSTHKSVGEQRKIEAEVEKTIQALDKVKRVKASSGFYGRLMKRIRDAEKVEN